MFRKYPKKFQAILDGLENNAIEKVEIDYPLVKTLHDDLGDKAASKAIAAVFEKLSGNTSVKTTHC